MCLSNTRAFGNWYIRVQGSGFGIQGLGFEVHIFVGIIIHEPWTLKFDLGTLREHEHLFLEASRKMKLDQALRVQKVLKWYRLSLFHLFVTP